MLSRITTRNRYVSNSTNLIFEISIFILHCWCIERFESSSETHCLNYVKNKARVLLHILSRLFFDQVLVIIKMNE